ncbi:hypothetical protein [Streptomyces antibioticus]|uniref:Uncharacterized protein n=1 Tax=Streptomyces antibioticus TaxID=1890 RepID=A0ABX3LKK0_STRAT|nr:hypothetical protein [Streptomyces antibioticus]MCX4739322.1 hypothetical protein [Streptomyces antibioticus]MCX5168895.1 hypothetical protein [Streptomyces antibioticus]OOQ51892.1 hypothetical protein AFM16_13025 [Streptomyces antibioticus]
MKRVVLGVAALSLVFGAAVAAFASPQKAKIPDLLSRGVEFTDASYRFNRPGVNHGAFEWQGLLKDALPDDRHNVYVDVKIEGHNWVRYYGKQGRSVLLHKSNWDGAQRYTGDARLRVCRDRGSLRPDNCAPLQILSYDWDHA